MPHTDDSRELLAADLALVLGIAEARDVAAALERSWDRRDEGGIGFTGELARIADLGESDVARLRREVERSLAEAGGDAREAILGRGGIDRTIHEAFWGESHEMSVALAGVGAREPVALHPMHDERYREFEPIGRGGMGIVYLALDTELNRRVAFKMVRTDAGDASPGAESPGPLEATPPEEDTPGSSRFAELTARFLQEAWVTGGLEHPGVLPVYELGRTPEGVPYYTMRFVRGARTLEDVMTGAATLEDRLGLLEPFLRVCDTIRYAHARGVIHRDLKPRNIVIGEFGEVVVIDWGLARTRDRPDLALSTWQKRIREFREAEHLETVTSVL